jgi:hypothetical protein
LLSHSDNDPAHVRLLSVKLDALIDNPTIKATTQTGEKIMKKQTNLHIIKFLLLVIVAAVVTILGTSLSASAQDQPKFKVGDRVEVDPQG